jgi:hypothetical protein
LQKVFQLLSYYKQKNLPVTEIRCLILITQITKSCIRHQPVFICMKEFFILFVIKKFIGSITENIIQYFQFCFYHFYIIYIRQLVQLQLFFCQCFDLCSIRFAGNFFKIDIKIGCNANAEIAAYGYESDQYDSQWYHLPVISV